MKTHRGSEANAIFMKVDVETPQSMDVRTTVESDFVKVW
jgi:hypothetical protein